MTQQRNRKKRAWLMGGVATLGILAPTLAWALDSSVGEGGINALRLHLPPYNLTGKKIGIGQVEVGRPGKFGLDKVYSWNPDVNIVGVFLRDRPANPNIHVDTHAAMVAMVMVSGEKSLPGVAPDAKLYSSAVGSLRRSGQPEECLASQHVALQNGGDVRAINYSFGETLERDARRNAILDGNALLTQCVDWSARVHDVLYVIAGNQGRGGIPIPTDLYNGISTAYTTQRDGKFTKVDFANLSDFPEGIGRSLIAREINVGERRAISLVAPGSKISVFDLEGNETRVSGTSFAAPHITASVALLQEYGDRQRRTLQTNTPQWTTDSRRHEVMKAVLLNSADKIQDTGDGMLLGMERTTLAKDNRTWLESDAYSNEEIPLDIQMGSGHLNAFRAYQQFSPGQWSPESVIPPIGWDYRPVEAQSYQEYILENPLQAGSFASVTLAWDRLVELEDKNDNNLFDVGESFRDRGLNDLNVYLLPVDSDNTSSSICASTSREDSIEHIFCKVPESGRYKIRVQYQQQENEPTQPYALAWWTVPTVNSQQ